MFGDVEVIEVDPAEPFAANAFGLAMPSSTRQFSADPGPARSPRPAGRAVDVSELAKAEAGVTCCCLSCPALFAAAVAVRIHCRSDEHLHGTLPMPSPEVQAVKEIAAAYERMTDQIGKVIVGQHEVVEADCSWPCSAAATACSSACPAWPRRCSSAPSRGSCTCRSSASSSRPDLMPADITGTDILQDDPETGRRKFVFLPGPLFANMILADEINRTPPKTQAALLEAMQEHHVTAGGHDVPAAGAVLRAGDAEPHRAGGDLPAARGAARPLHVQHHGRLPEPRRKRSRS